MIRPTVAQIDLDRLVRNFARLKERSNGWICPMVKANAYGHGDVEVARALRAIGCEQLGVALIEEGLNLRAAGDTGDILVFGAFFDLESARALTEHRLSAVVGDFHQLDLLAQAAADAGTTVHVEFNTGMNRLGFDVGDAARVRSWLDRHPKVRLGGVCTHLVRGDDAGEKSGRSLEQLRTFRKLSEEFSDLRPRLHTLNSAGLLNFHDPKEFGTRPGIALYGIEDGSVHLGLETVLSWTSCLVELRRIPGGASVSYNATWTAPAGGAMIGVVAAGYADGYARLLSNQGEVLCRGHRARVAGTVCMDYFMIDLTEIERATGGIEPGEPVVLIGEQGGERVTARELAQKTGTIAYEVLTSIGARVPRSYLSAARHKQGAGS